MSRRKHKQGPRLTFRGWAGALVVAAVAGVVTQILVHELFMSTGMLAHRVISGALDTLVVLVPILMYFGWRRTAALEERTLHELQASEALREDLVNMLVHDLKGPVVTAGMALNALARGEASAKLFTGEDREMIQIATQGIMRLEHLIGDTLDTASAEKGNLRLDTTRVDLTEIARAAALGAALQAKDRNIELVHRPPQGAVYVQGDPERLRRVMDNLLGNAVRFTPPGGRIEVRVMRDDGKATATVKDSGPGVPADMREHIFEKYAQAESGSQVAVAF